MNPNEAPKPIGMTNLQLPATAPEFEVFVVIPDERSSER
jgi:hypothetical protein